MKKLLLCMSGHEDKSQSMKSQPKIRRKIGAGE